MSALPNLTIPGLTPPNGARKVAEIDVIRRIDYYDFRRIRLNGNKGTLFTLATDRNINSLRDAYSNVLLLAGRAQYAPEKRTQYVFVSDKRFV